jgi:hypothetical protein
MNPQTIAQLESSYLKSCLSPALLQIIGDARISIEGSTINLHFKSFSGLSIAEAGYDLFNVDPHLKGKLTEIRFHFNDRSLSLPLNRKIEGLKLPLIDF